MSHSKYCTKSEKNESEVEISRKSYSSSLKQQVWTAYMWRIKQTYLLFILDIILNYYHRSIMAQMLDYHAASRTGSVGCQSSVVKRLVNEYNMYARPDDQLSAEQFQTVTQYRKYLQSQFF